jgi:hypothetical protein
VTAQEFARRRSQLPVVVGREVIDLASIWRNGTGLQRSECVLANARGDLRSASLGYVLDDTIHAFRSPIAGLCAGAREPASVSLKGAIATGPPAPPDPATASGSLVESTYRTIRQRVVDNVRPSKAPLKPPIEASRNPERAFKANETKSHGRRM